MNIISVTNPIYSNSDNSHIDCTATFDNGQIYRYTATATDPMPYGQQLWDDLKTGVYGAIGVYVLPA